MLNILYVEDNANSRSVLTMIQRITPDLFNLTMFEDSRDFATRLSNLKPQPDLILLDIHVEPHNGFEMLKMVRAMPVYDRTPVIALTASVMNEEINTLQEAGFQGVISKPLNIDEFPDIIGRIMAGERVWYVW